MRNMRVPRPLQTSLVGWHMTNNQQGLQSDNNSLSMLSYKKAILRD